MDFTDIIISIKSSWLDILYYIIMFYLFLYYLFYLL